MGDFLGLVDLTSDDQCVAIRHVPGDCADHMRLPSGRERPVDRNAPDGIIHLEIGRKPFQVARYLAAVCAEQTGILNAAGVPLNVSGSALLASISFSRSGSENEAGPTDIVDHWRFARPVHLVAQPT